MPEPLKVQIIVDKKRKVSGDTIVGIGALIVSILVMFDTVWSTNKNLTYTSDQVELAKKIYLRDSSQRHDDSVNSAESFKRQDSINLENLKFFRQQNLIAERNLDYQKYLHNQSLMADAPHVKLDSLVYESIGPIELVHAFIRNVGRRVARINRFSLTMINSDLHVHDTKPFHTLYELYPQETIESQSRPIAPNFFISGDSYCLVEVEFTDEFTGKKDRFKEAYMFTSRMQKNRFIIYPILIVDEARKMKSLTYLIKVLINLS